MIKMIYRRKLIGESLIEEGLINREQLADALREQASQTEHQLLGEIVVRLGFVAQEKMPAFLALHFNVPYLRLSDVSLDPKVVSLIPEEMAWEFNVIAIGKEGSTLTVAIADPTDVITLDNIRIKTGCELKRVLSPKEEIREALRKYY
jgi:type IV pilus assembly protein PilB